MNFDRLRFVAERAELGENREAIFAVTIPEQSGSLRKFFELLGKRNLTEFSYRIVYPVLSHFFIRLHIFYPAYPATLATTFSFSLLHYYHFYIFSFFFLYINTHTPYIYTSLFFCNFKFL